MRAINISGRVLFISSLLFIFLQIHGQVNECKVLMPQISGTYAGNCKNGLAHGKGIATGTDRYEGEFSKGLPHGDGIYEFTGGPVYKGEWNKGLKQGRGEIIYHTVRGDSVVKGFWRADKYIGEENLPPYDIIRKDNLLSVNISKEGQENVIVIRYMMKGQINSKVRGLSMVYSSGTQFKTGTYEGLQDVRFPLELKITYNTNNPISRSSFDVVFECTINESGKWEITLNN